MKTSLLIDDLVFKEAKKEAAKTGESVSQVINLWARVGREEWQKRKQGKQMEFQPVNLGEPQLDLSNRKNWMEELENDRD